MAAFFVLSASNLRFLICDLWSEMSCFYWIIFYGNNQILFVAGKFSIFICYFQFHLLFAHPIIP